MGRRLVLRHLVLGLVAFALWAVFWLTRLDWTPEMRFWRAVGDASFMLLIFALAIGPLARLWSVAGRLLSWRRESGIWFGLLALAHTLLILNGWLRWDLPRFFGYEFIPELGRSARIEPGFGLANLVGMVALLWALVLTAASSDRAIRALGSAAWKWLQYGAYSIFYLVALHTFYFLFMHYTLSFHRPVPPNPNWFQVPFLVLVLAVPVLQIGAFVKTVRRKRTGEGASVPKVPRGRRREERRT
jgi:methionine sulfoxide reductase heme-binding subunit